MPWGNRGKRGSHGVQGQRTFDAQMTKMPFKVIDCRKKDFHVKDELFRHLDGFQVLPAAHVS
jgi:hypothetical protein